MYQLSKNRCLRRTSQKGVTLLELMIVVALLSIILAIGVPSFNDQIEKGELKGLAEQLSAHITLVRSEAITRSLATYINFSTGADWIYGLSTRSNCNVNALTAAAANACTLVFEDGDDDRDPGDGSVDVDDLVLNRYDSTEHMGNSLAISNFSSGNSQIWFDPVRGISDSGEIIVTSTPSNYQLKVKVGLLGDVRICSPNGDLNFSSANC